MTTTLGPAERLKNISAMLKRIVESTDCAKIEGLEGDLGFAILALNEVAAGMNGNLQYAIFDLRCRVAGLAEEQNRVNERLTAATAHNTMLSVFDLIQLSSPMDALYHFASVVKKKEPDNVAVKHFVTEWYDREAKAGEL